MSLEHDIQQKEFRSEYHKAFLNILYTHNHLVGYMNDAFKEFDITRQQYNVLRILRGQYPNPASINMIKDRMLDNMSDASRIVERLRLKELVQREESKDDKRAVDVSITEKGLALLNLMQKEIDTLDGILHNLSEDETVELNRLLDKVRGSRKTIKAEVVQERELIR